MYETVSECVKLPISAIQSAHGYKRVVDGGGNQADVFTIRNRCVFLRRVYVISLKKLGKETMKFVNDCCK